MEYRELGSTGFKVSAVAYGGIVSAVHYGGIVSPEEGTSDDYVRWAVEQGVNYFDVAPAYGDAESRLGPSLAPYRKDVYLACKTERRTYAEAKEHFLRSRELLRTDYFDVYQLHAVVSMQDVDTAFSKGGVMELMDELRRSGAARKIGFTAHNEDAALRMLELYDFDTVLFPYNWHMNLSKGMGSRLLRVLKERGIGALCMKSMIERAWDLPADAEAQARWPKSWCKPIEPEEEDFLVAALKYVVSLGVDTIIPPGNIRHFRFAVEHADEILHTPLSEEERALLRERLEKVRAYPFF